MRTNENGNHDPSAVLENTFETTLTKYPLIPGEELDNLPPTQWLIDEILPEGKLCVLFGQPGVGKTFVALDMALEVAQDHPVVYAASEGFTGLSKRQKAWYKHQQKDRGTIFFGSEPLLLMNSNSVQVFIDSVSQVSPKLIIVDTLAWALSGGDENSAKDMQIAITACRRIQQETGAAILLVHHTVKRGNGERGSSALRGAADVMIELTAEEDTIVMSCSKAKDTAPFENRYYKLMQVAIEDDTSCVIMPADKVVQGPNDLSKGQRAVLEQLSLEIFTKSGAKSTQIIAGVELGASTVFRLLSQLKRRGFVRQGGQQGRPLPYYRQR